MTSGETDFQFCSLVPNDPNKGFFSPVATDHSAAALERLTDQSCGEILQLSWKYEQGTLMKTHHEKGLSSILPERSREHSEPFTVCNWTPHKERTTSRGDFTPPQTNAPLCGRLLSWQGRSREWHRGESHAQSQTRWFVPRHPRQQTAGVEHLFTIKSKSWHNQMETQSLLLFFCF